MKTANRLFRWILARTVTKSKLPNTAAAHPTSCQCLSTQRVIKESKVNRIWRYISHFDGGLHFGYSHHRLTDPEPGARIDIKMIYPQKNCPKEKVPRYKKVLKRRVSDKKVQDGRASMISGKLREVFAPGVTFILGCVACNIATDHASSDQPRPSKIGPLPIVSLFGPPGGSGAYLGI